MLMLELIQFLGAFDSKLLRFKAVPSQTQGILQKGNTDLSSSNPSPELCELVLYFGNTP